MRKKHNLLVSVIVLALVAGLFYMMQSSSSQNKSRPSTLDAIKATIAGVELAYPSTYGVYEKVNSPYTKTLSTVVWYENTQPNKNFFTGGAGAPSEPPLTMSLDVYNNPNNISAKELLGEGNAYMFANGAGKPVVIAGTEGVLFDWSGLYKGKSIMVNNKGFLYVFSVTSITSNDTILKDFDLLLSSAAFK